MVSSSATTSISHHTYYSKDHLVSRTYLGDEGNNTPLLFIPVFLVGACTYLLLPVESFVVQAVACAASFYAHVFFDKIAREGSRLQRFAWFRRKQKLHFVHHRHANSNFAVIHFFWDRIFSALIEGRMLDRLQANGTLRSQAVGRSTQHGCDMTRRKWNQMPVLALNVFPCAVPLAKETPSPPGWRGRTFLANDDLIWGADAIASEIRKRFGQPTTCLSTD